MGTKDKRREFSCASINKTRHFAPSCVQRVISGLSNITGHPTAMKWRASGMQTAINIEHTGEEV